MYMSALYNSSNTFFVDVLSSNIECVHPCANLGIKNCYFTRLTKINQYYYPEISIFVVLIYLICNILGKPIKPHSIIIVFKNGY